MYAGLVDFDEYRRQQAEWLATDLGSATAQEATFVVALFHIPPYGTWDVRAISHPPTPHASWSPNRSACSDSPEPRRR